MDQWLETKQLPVHFVSAAGVVYKDGKVLLIRSERRGWEFPGGKVEAGETPQQALKREIEEELNTEIEVGDYLTTVEYDYPKFHLSMKCYWARIVEGKPVLLEHEAARWLTKETLDTVSWLPADSTIIEEIKKHL